MNSRVRWIIWRPSYVIVSAIGMHGIPWAPRNPYSEFMVTLYASLRLVPERVLKRVGRVLLHLPLGVLSTVRERRKQTRQDRRRMDPSGCTNV